MDKERKTALIVDDDEDYLFQMEANLQRLDYEVTTASSVQEATAIMEENRDVDLVLVDLMMDNMDDGFVLAHKIRRINENIPIIMTTSVAKDTGYEFDSVKGENREWLKIDKILNKPVRFEQLKTVLATLK
ncbi:MAG: response regulator [Deltaproteobacteria bacterium]|jgi:CheY-like chemotaxis protein|nr:response regulator [Deltaproteobacteria bacterium]